MASFAAAAAGITLVSSDDQRIEISHEAAQLSSYIRSYLEENAGERELSVPVVSGATLAKVVEFSLNYIGTPMTEIPKPLTKSEISELVQPFYAELVNSLSHDNLRNLAIAANFMGVAPLLALCCAKIASLIHGKSPAEIRANLNLSTDFTPEQEAKIRSENEWADEL